MKKTGNIYAIVFAEKEIDCLVGKTGDVTLIPVFADVELAIATRGRNYVTVQSVVGVETSSKIVEDISHNLEAFFKTIDNDTLRLYLRSHFGPLLARISKIAILEELLRRLTMQNDVKIYIHEEYRDWLRHIILDPESLGQIPATVQFIWGKSGRGSARALLNIFIIVLSKTPLQILLKLFNFLELIAKIIIKRKYPLKLHTFDDNYIEIYVPYPGRLCELDQEITSKIHLAYTTKIVIIDEKEKYQLKEKYISVFRGQFLLSHLNGYLRLCFQLLLTTIFLKLLVPDHSNTWCTAFARYIAPAFTLHPAAEALAQHIYRVARPMRTMIDNGSDALSRLLFHVSAHNNVESHVLFHGQILCNEPYLRDMPGATAHAWGPWLAKQLEGILSSPNKVIVSGSKRVGRASSCRAVNGPLKLLFAPSYIFKHAYHASYEEQISAARLLLHCAQEIGDVELIIRPSPRGGEEQHRLWRSIGNVTIDRGSLHDAIGSCHMFAVVASTVFYDFVASGGPVVVVDTRGWIKLGGIPFGVENGIYRIESEAQAKPVLQAMIDELKSSDNTMRLRRQELFSMLVASDPDPAIALVPGNAP